MSNASNSSSTSSFNGEHEEKYDRSDPECISSNIDANKIERQPTREEIEQEAKDEVAEKINNGQPVPLASLDWDGPDDPENPKNWKNPYKWFITMTVAWMCLVVSFGSSLYTTGIEHIMVEFKASQVLALSGLTFYLLGLSLGPVLGAPMSELLGRRYVYIITLSVSMLFVMGVGLSKHMRDILVLRFFAGFFASPVMAIAGGTINDIWDFENVGIAMSSFCLAPFAGPILGPIIGGFAMEHKGWKWTSWIHLFFSGAILPLVLILPETYKPALMRQRAKKRGITIEKPNVSSFELFKILMNITVMRPLTMLVSEPIVIVFSFYTALVFAILFGFFEAYPVIYRGIYHMSLGPSGLPFIGIGIGLLFATAIYVYIDRTKFFPLNADGTRGRRDAQGNLAPIAPELFLIIAKIGAPLLPISLFWQAWTARASVHWMAPVAAGVPFGIALMLIFYTTLLYFSGSYPPLILASVLAANNFCRYIIASVFPLFTVQMYEKMGVDWASSFFAFVSLAMVPIPWIFEKWGPQLRAASRYNKLAARQAAEARHDAESVTELELTRTISYRV